MSSFQDSHGTRRIYQITETVESCSVRLSDRIVDLGPRELEDWRKVTDWLSSGGDMRDLARSLATDEPRALRFLSTLEDVGLLYRRARPAPEITGDELYERFAAVIPSWLSKAFSHPFWDRMLGGAGSARLFTGWLIELYHFTLNANRHMPLACAHASEKALKQLRARHYAEEWNHYHYFMKALKALGVAEAETAQSVPLPMTLALSNFMRQAAREDILAYSICSAVLESTTTEPSAYGPYYEKCAALYGIPAGAVIPIYAHLEMDTKYGHRDLFREILHNVSSVSADRAARVLEYGHQLVEHIWMWTDNVEKYYADENAELPRRPFDLRAPTTSSSALRSHSSPFAVTAPRARVDRAPPTSPRANDLPILKRTAAVVNRSLDRIVFHHLGNEVVLEGAAASLFDQVEARLDGRTSLAALAELTGESRERLERWLDSLATAGVLAFLSAEADGAPVMTGHAFHALHREHCLHWLEPVYRHPLWDKITSGRATRSQVVGFAFEKYHYIEAAYEHMGLAAANATAETIPHLARHFVEEHAHGDIYRAGLRTLFPDEVVRRSQPLPTTRALINYMNEAAQRSSFAYAAGNELLQLTENVDDPSTAGAVDGFYLAMRTHYPYADGLVDAFVAHTNADQKLGHPHAFLHLCEVIRPLPLREINEALNVTRGVAEHLYLFLDGIDVLYDQFPNVPRRPTELLTD